MAIAYVDIAVKITLGNFFTKFYGCSLSAISDVYRVRFIRILGVTWGWGGEGGGRGVVVEPEEVKDDT
jgi:hypothetical protein